MSLLPFSLIFSLFLFGLLWPIFLFGLLWYLLFFIKSGDSSQLVRESLLPSSFPHLGQCSKNDDHHTFIFLQLNNYNSTITTRYLEQNMTLYECLRRCTGICNESRVTCMKAQQNKLSGCASNLLAHEDLGHLRKPIVGIYKPSSIM